MSTCSVKPTVAAPVPVITPVRDGILQRSCDCGQRTISGAECEGCKKKKLTLQRHSDGSAGPATAPPIVHEVLRAPGQPLDSETRAFMESRFGRDFSRVRISADDRAGESARAVNALSYTVGNKIVFGAGQYAPWTDTGKQLLAHELAHTVQQQDSGTSATSSRLTVTDPADSSEVEADHAAKSVWKGSGAPVGHTAAKQLARQASTAAPATKGSPPDASKKEPPKRPEQEGELNVHRSGFGAFDSELDRRLAGRKQPCRLTLTVNVNFKPQGPWPPRSFAKWQNDLVRIVTNRWSFRFLLAPTQPCMDEPCNSATAILNVVPVATSGSNVHDVTVNYVKPPGTRSSSATLYASDVQSPGKDLRRGHVVASHEAGHWLGLEHIHCNTNADECYGVTDEEKADVMGHGEIVRERDYAPFAETISRITKCIWKPVGHGESKVFGSSWIAPLAILGGLGGAFGGAALGASLGLGAALGVGAALGAAGALVGGVIGLGLDEVAR